MANRLDRPVTEAVEPIAHNSDLRDQDVAEALVTAGALVALADGDANEVERDELITFIDQQGFVPTATPEDIGAAFDRRITQLDSAFCANVILETLRPIANQSLGSVVMRTAERVAAADRRIQPGELRALKLLRRIIINLPAIRADGGSGISQTAMRLMECEHCGAVVIPPTWLAGFDSEGDLSHRHEPIDTSESENDQQAKEGLPKELIQRFFPSLVIA